MLELLVRSRGCVLFGSRLQRNNANDGGASPYSPPRSQVVEVVLQDEEGRTMD
jgi:hypothetical protein